MEYAIFLSQPILILWEQFYFPYHFNLRLWLPTHRNTPLAYNTKSNHLYHHFSLNDCPQLSSFLSTNYVPWFVFMFSKSGSHCWVTIKKQGDNMYQLLATLNENKFHLLDLPGVVSIGIGPKICNNTYTGQMSLIIGVEKKQDRALLSRSETIPTFLSNTPTDVIEVGKITFQGFCLPLRPQTKKEPVVELRKNKVRPAVPGISIGHYQITAGTLGAIIQGDFPQGIALLSNNHILANGSDGKDGLAYVGDPIMQPGPYDGGGKNDILAQLYDFNPYNWISPADYRKGKKPIPNVMDAAVAIPLDPANVQNKILGLGFVQGYTEPRPGMFVAKSGRSTGTTRGRIISIHNTFYLEDGERAYIFEEQFATTPMSDNGDSGSLITTAAGKKAVGLLFAGSNRITYATPISRVLQRFHATL